MCARDLARYTHPPLAPKPFSAAEEAADKPSGAGRPAIKLIPTPRAVSEAFRRAAAGLPPEPRKRL